MFILYSKNMKIKVSTCQTETNWKGFEKAVNVYNKVEAIKLISYFIKSKKILK